MTTARNNPAPTATLRASYTGPTSSQTFSHPLPSAPVTSTEGKIIHLSAARKSVTQLQQDVNVFLTTKMEEDKALAANAEVMADDKAEEEGYGEESVEDEG